MSAAPRLLVRVPSWLGDLVACEPVLRAIHAQGAWELSIAGPAHLLPILDGALERARRIPHAGRGGERARDWRGHDAALLLAGSFRSAWTAWRAGIPRRVGWVRDARGWLLTGGMRPPRERGRTPLGVGRPGPWPRYVPRPFGAACVEIAGALGVPVGDTRPRLAVLPAAEARARAARARVGLAPAERFALVNAGARPGSAKGAPPELWGAAIRGLGLPALIVGGPGEEEPVRRAAAAAAPARALALGDPPCDLQELAAHARAAAVVLTADSGPRHVAAAVGARVVCVAGPTDPRHSAEHLETTRVLRVEVPCGPCHRERCPLSGAAEHACMRGIAAERIVEAARELAGG